MESSSYFTGDCKALDDFLKRKQGPAWGLLKFLNALFRGVGQVVFANNPWSGLIILASLYWASLEVGFATTVAATTAILTAIVFKQDESQISAGLTTYCAVLVGSVTSSIWEPMYGEPIGPTLWGFIVLAAALSVLVNVALGNIFGSFRPTLPSFTLAFNIVTILVFWTVQPRPATTTTARALSLQNSEKASALLHYFGPVSKGRAEAKGLDILSVVEGIMLSMGQVYGVQHLKGSVAMYLGTILYSPIVCIMSLVGATVGTLFGIVFDGPTYSNVYIGIWGFNAILAAIAVGAFFYVPTPLSLLTALADVALVVLIQKALSLSFTPLKLPFLTYPFVISSIFFLEITATGDKLTRVKNLSYPEKHLQDFLQEKEKKKEGDGMMGAKPKLSPSAPLLPVFHSDNHYHPHYDEPQTQLQLYPAIPQNVNRNPNLYHHLQQPINPGYRTHAHELISLRSHLVPSLPYDLKYNNTGFLNEAQKNR